MLTNDQEELYQNISKICKIIIPFLYVLIAIVVFAGFYVPSQVILDNEIKVVVNNIELDVTKLTTDAKYIVSFAMIVMFGLVLRFFWLTIKILKRFKNREIFSEGNAKLAYKIATSLLLIFITKLLYSAYVSVLIGDLQLDFSDLATLAFAYLFAWILNIGSQLKAENDLTV